MRDPFNYAYIPAKEYLNGKFYLHNLYNVDKIYIYIYIIKLSGETRESTSPRHV